MFFNVVHALAVEGRSWEERAELAADLASPHAPALPADPEGEADGGVVVVPDEIPAWMQGLIP